MRFDMSDRKWEVIDPLLLLTRQAGRHANDREVASNGVLQPMTPDLTVTTIGAHTQFLCPRQTYLGSTVSGGV